MPSVLTAPQTPTLSAYRGRHAGETVVVCGCGSSLVTLSHPQRFVTIGVNDVGRLFQPDYLVVVNPRQQFQAERFRHVEESRARALFTQLDLGVRHPNIVRFQLGRRAGTDFSNPNVLHYTNNSPYVALCLALHMGARRIGLIGVDFTDHHFFAHTNKHPLEAQLPQIDREYRQLYEACARQGIEIFNLSAASRLTAFPKLPLAEFQADAHPAPPLNIVSYATTPVAGVPLILSRSIAARTPHACRTVWATHTYGNGVAFDSDIEWDRAPQAAQAALEGARLVIVHNGKLDPRHRALLAGKPILTMAHNYLWNVDSTFVQQGFPGVVVGQYQATLAEFEGWQPVPNPVPLWDPAFQPEPKPPEVTICYTPSGRHESYPPSHRLYWHSKGFDSTMRVLEKLVRTHGIRLEVLRRGPVPHAESLAMKRRSHIVIDECVTGSYHRNSLEGLALGCVVVNGIGRLPAVADVFRRCSGVSEVPFVSAGLDDLESVLRALIEQGTAALATAGARNRLWMEEHWDFANQWKRFWEPAVAQALDRAAKPNAPVSIRTNGTHREEDAMGNESVLAALKSGLSAVVCHGGKDRLPHLSASLANLRQCQGVDEIVVVEMGDSPWAEDTARKWADKYVFIPNGDVFERARSLNTGTALAEYDLVLWKDNDLIVPPGFIAAAVAEMRTRQLDFLIPYTAVHYLSEADSGRVMQGALSPHDCKPAKTFHAVRQNCGAAGLVRRSFVLRYGGMSEEFRGWGGEDDAWWHKAQLLGRASISGRRDQFLFHLYHAHSGSNGDGSQIAANPYYPQNLALLKSTRTLRTRDAFLKRFPPAATLSGVWANRRVLVVGEAPDANPEWPADRVCADLGRLFGIAAEHRFTANGDGSWLHHAVAHPPEALVLAGLNLASQFLSREELSHLWPRTLVVLPGDEPAESPEILGRAAAILPLRASAAQSLEDAGLRPWMPNRIPQQPRAGLSAAFELLQPLSILLGGAMPRKVKKTAKAVPTETPKPRIAGSSADLPVWLYWEGECPAWIEACRRTITAHAPDVRLLSPAEFDKLRDADRDIDLQRLQTAHRADFIRAFLLARYGGLWIDADCIVMQSLKPVLALLDRFDLVAHRERSGYASNGFLASRPGGAIASALYRRICEILRSHRPIGWISLGGEPLTELLKAPGAAWHEMECERVQPICWSNPGAFFASADDAAHSAAFDPHAICYMLSNTEVQRFQAANPSADLLRQDTFFSYLVRKSLQGAEAPSRDAGPAFQQVPFCLEAIAALQPQRVLDIGTGTGRWGVLIRDFCAQPRQQGAADAPVLQIERVEPFAESPVEASQRPQYTSVGTPVGDDMSAIFHRGWDLILIGDILDRWPKEAGRNVLEQALDAAAYVLVNNSIQSAPSQSCWTLADLLETDPVRHAVFTGRQDYGSFLLSRHDPKGLRPASPLAEIFSRHIDVYVRTGDESLSGPGSSLYHTGEIRQRLPLLFQELDIASLLDAPCGDFNWMRHVALPQVEYTGVDIVPALIERNQKQYGGPRRQFLTLDLTRSPLPKADLVQCRDCLPHLAYEDIFRVLRNFKRSGATYLLTTTFERLPRNTDIATGGWRPLNLERAPFHFPKPLRMVNEKCQEAGGMYADKSLALWKIEALPL